VGIKEKLDLTGEAAIVTGAARGIGRAIALALAEFGADVAIFDIDGEGAERTAEEVEALGRRGLGLKVDVTKREEVEQGVRRVVEEFGKVDILVNNAGICINAPAEEMTEEQWDAVMDVNLRAVFICSQVVGREMIKRKKGSIVNIASMSGLIVNRPQPQVSYNASKAGVIALTRSLAVEWAKHGIRVNAISPGYIRTEITLSRSDLIPEWIPNIPMGRMGEPEEVAALAVFLASEASSYVTGANFVVDGGYTAL